MTIDKIISKTFYKQFVNNNNLNIDDVLKLYVFEGFLGNVYMNSDDCYKYNLLKFKYLLKNKIIELGNTDNNYYKRFNKKLSKYNIGISKINDKGHYVVMSIQPSDKPEPAFNIINKTTSRIHINNEINLNEKLIKEYDDKFIERAKKNVTYYSKKFKEENNNIYEGIERLFNIHYEETDDNDSDNDGDNDGDSIDIDIDDDDDSNFSYDTNFSNDSNFIEDYSDVDDRDYDEYSSCSDNTETESNNDIFEDSYQKDIEERVFTCYFYFEIKIEKKYLNKDYYKAYFEYLHIIYNAEHLYTVYIKFDAKKNDKYIIVSMMLKFDFSNIDYLWTNMFNFNTYSQKRKADHKNNNIIKKNINYINEKILQKLLVLI
jgi:hypothetical protein